MRKISLADLFNLALARHGTQCAVAKKCGITQSMVSLYLNGKVKTVRAENVVRIAHCLGIKPTLLLNACLESGSITPRKID